MKYIHIWVLLFFGLAAQAQTITGKVTDQNNNAIEDVAIFNKNSGSHSHTDLNGFFTLDRVSIGDAIYFSHLGYGANTYLVEEINSQNRLDITLNEQAFSLQQVTVSPQVNVLDQIARVDLETSPVRSSQELLRKVPGLFIGQHAGGGKAEKIFLRGFDIDHGTDISLSVDGLPVNMVSHAHGQGYSDLHFLIPETIEKIEFGKGPYNADKGDFATAGYVAFETKEKIDRSSVSMEIGDFNSYRTVGLFNLLNTKTSDAYIAASLNTFDGPYVSPQNFNRFNILGKYTLKLPDNQKLSLTASYFQSKWDASGQIPQRAVDAGTIGRFGAIDDTEGGNTSRTNVYVNHGKTLDGDKKLQTNAYFSQYDFELFSNFTFFLEDPINGDQIAQREDRNILEFETKLSEKKYFSNFDFEYTAGFGVRYDDVNGNELSRTKNRYEILERLAFGNVDQLNTFGYLNTEFHFGNFKINPALRLDYFKFDYENFLSETYDNKSESKVFASPKLNFIYSPNNRFQLFLKTGIGFHSNDARVVVANSGKDILPAAYGADFGSIYKLAERLILNGSIWTLFLDQEFVYVGDAGIVEPSGKSRRLGADFGIRYEVTDWLYLFGDINYTYARSTEEPNGQDYIPLAPDLTSTGGITFKELNNFSGGINYRYLKDRAANEDNSIIADGYLVTDLNVSYTYKNATFGIIVENLFDVEWNETQFATESRLFNEPESVEEIHFTPGTPFFLKGKITYNF